MKINMDRKPKNCNHCIYRENVSRYFDLDDYCSKNMKRTGEIIMDEDCPLGKEGGDIMLLIAGNDNETLDRGNASYMDGYEYNLPKKLMQKIYEYNIKLKDLWMEYLKSLKKERTYAV